MTWLAAFGAAMILFGVAVPAAPAFASAAVVFNNGPALPGAGGSDISMRRAANAFVLGDAAVVPGGTFTYSTSGAFFTPSGVRYFIYGASGAGTGNDPPGELLGSGDLIITDAQFIDDRGGLNLIAHYVATFRLSNPFRAEAGMRYWLALNAQAAPGAPEAPQLGWVASDFFSDTRTWEQSRFDGPPYSVWRSVDYERAFSLTAGVPEPSAWAMMLLGFGGLGVLARRRRSSARVAA